LCALSVGAAKLSPRIVVLSDLHVVEPALSQSITIAKGERKLLKHSAELFDLAIEQVLEEAPCMLLVTGDLTDRGDIASHRYVAAQLARVKATGTQVLVIPGNHDISNEVSKEQFAQLYSDFGYDSAIRDDNSLSYVCEPSKGVVVLAIDSNGDSSAAVRWAAGQAAQCKGKNVIAMMHHHLVPHFVQESMVMPTSVVGLSQSSCDALVDAGVKLVLTGHTHIHDAAVGYNSERTDSIIDVCTAALAAYPHYYRVLTLKGKKVVDDETRVVSDAYSEESRRLLENALPALVQGFGRKYWDKAQNLVSGNPLVQRMFVEGLDWDKVSALIDTHLTPALTEVYLVTSRGNEPEQDTDKLKKDLNEGILAVIQGVVRPQFREAAAELFAAAIKVQLMPIVNSMLNDTNPPSYTPVDDLKFTATKK